MFCQQLGAQLLRLSIALKRRKSFLIIELLVPVIFIVVGLGLSFIQFFKNSPALPLTVSTQQPLYLNANPSDSLFQYFNSTIFRPTLLPGISSNATIQALEEFDFAVF